MNTPSLLNQETMADDSAEGAADVAGPGLVVCPRCKQQNPSSRKFCTSCGSGLWGACAECGNSTIAGEEYCGICGTNLAEAARKRQRDNEAAFQQVDKLESESRYDDALALLQSMARPDRPQTADHTQRVRGLMTKLVALRVSRRIEVQTVVAEARDLASTADYARAFDVLSSVPESLRTQELSDLLGEVRSHNDQVAQLEAQIRVLAAQKDSLSLLPKLAEFLQLKPGHAEAERLATRLAERIRLAAKKKLDNHEYEASLRSIECVPDLLKTDDAKSLRDDAAELAWLLWDLRNAPFVDRTLLALADRLCRRSPKDELAWDLRENLRRRAKSANKEPQPGLVPWTAPPARTVLDCSIDWLTQFRAAGYREGLDLSPLSGHPGQFFVACGLALQGLEKAAFRTNLRPSPAGVVDRLTRILPRSAARAAWGIDLSPTSLKAVKLAWNARRQQAVVEECYYAEHARLLAPVVQEREQRAAAVESIAALRKQLNIGNDSVCVGLAGAAVLQRELRLPPMKPSKVASAVQYEAAHQLPYRLDELVWDYHIMNEGGNADAPDHGYTVLLVAANRKHLALHLDTLVEAGLPIHAVQPDSLALRNVLDYECPDCRTATSQPVEQTESVALLDIGCDVSNLVIGSPGHAWCRSIGLGGQHITKALARHLDLTLADAERIKRSPESSDKLSRCYEAVEPTLRILLEEIQRSLAAFTSAHPGRRIGRLLGVGGGFQFHGLLTYLRLGVLGPFPRG